MAARNVSGYLPTLLGPVELQENSTAITPRAKIDFAGDVEYSDDPDNETARFTFQAKSLNGDDDDVAEISAKEVVATSDATCEPRSILDHVVTEDATPVHYTLRTLLDPEVLSIIIQITATNVDASKHGFWSLRCGVKRSGGGATLIGDGTDPDAEASAGLDAEITVTGNIARLTLTGDAGEDITFGFEIRLQKQVMAA